MTTTNEPTIEDLNPGLKGLGTYEYGWADSDTAGATARAASTRPSSRTSRGARVSPRGCASSG
jgi:Fe-S cluster assembly protein SufB